MSSSSLTTATFKKVGSRPMAKQKRTACTAGSRKMNMNTLKMRTDTISESGHEQRKIDIEIPIEFQVEVPNVAESLHKVLADEGQCTVRWGDGQSEGAAASFARQTGGGRAAAAAVGVTVVAARAAAAVIAVLHVVQTAVFGLVRVVAVALIVQGVHVVDVLLLLHVERRQVVAWWAECQPHDAILFLGKNRFVVLPVLPIRHIEILLLSWLTFHNCFSDTFQQLFRKLISIELLLNESSITHWNNVEW